MKKLLDTKASAEKKNKELDELKKNMRKLSREAEDKAKLLVSGMSHNKYHIEEGVLTKPDSWWQFCFQKIFAHFISSAFFLKDESWFLITLK